jgi:hypothetical protein
VNEQRSLLEALEPINPHHQVNRIPGIDAPCMCAWDRDMCLWPFCKPPEQPTQEDE